MAFSSLLFVLCFFLFAAGAQYVCKGITQRNLILLIFSLIFYLFAGLKSLLLVIIVTVICWLWGRIMEESNSESVRKAALGISVALCLVVLLIFQFWIRFMASANTVAPTVGDIVNPVGLSIYGLQMISYVVDVYRRRIPPEDSLVRLLLFASLFQLSMVGPAVRYRELRGELEDRTITRQDVGKGVSRFSIGLAKLAILANGCANLADALFPQNLDTLYAVPAAGLWVGMLCYLLTFYLTLSACSDMAIGLGRIFGFHFPENFRAPFQATSLRDLGRRWMRPVSAFFDEYVYQTICHKRRSRQLAATLAACVLMALWYGASLPHLLWGLYLFVFVTLEQKFLGKKLKALPGFVGQIWTLLVTYFGCMFLGTNSIAAPGIVIKGLFAGNGNGWMNEALGAAIRHNLLFLVVAVLAVTPLWSMLYTMLTNLARGNRVALYVHGVWEAVYPALLLLISVLILAGGSGTALSYLQF